VSENKSLFPTSAEHLACSWFKYKIKLFLQARKEEINSKLQFYVESVLPSIVDRGSLKEWERCEQCERLLFAWHSRFKQQTHCGRNVSRSRAT
jgi:hypothetical protein